MTYPPVTTVRRSVLRIAIAALLACSSAACGGSNSGDSGNTPDGGSTPSGDIVGGELLGWDQLAPDPDTARAYTYTLFVDGTRGGTLNDVRCDAAESPVGYRCSSELPNLPKGSHNLQVSASANGQESPLSAPISVNVR